MEDGFCLRNSWKPLICSLKNRKKPPSRDSRCRSMHTALIRALSSLHPDVPACFRVICPLIPHRMPATHFTPCPLHVGSLPATPLQCSPCLFPIPAKPPLSRAIKNPVLVSYWFAQWSCENLAVSFCTTASQWELKSTLPFPSCFLHNPKFPASRLLGLPSAFTVVSCSAFSTLKMEAIYSSETLVDFQGATRRYIPDDNTLLFQNCLNFVRLVYLVA
jgi:hypothetical protein